MDDLVHKPLTRFVQKIGSCATCMRQSLQAAIAAWILFALAFTYYTGTSLAFALQSVASALTVLWLVHVATYSGRALGKSHSIEGHVAGAGVANAGQNGLERRGAIRILLQAAAVGAIASLPLVLRPSTAFAFCGQCSRSSDCGTCRCVNTAGPGQPVCNECKCP